MVILRGVLRVSQETHLTHSIRRIHSRSTSRQLTASYIIWSLSLHLTAQTNNGLLTQSAAAAIKIYLNQKISGEGALTAAVKIELSAFVG